MGKDFSVGILALGLFAVLTVVGIAERTIGPRAEGSPRRCGAPAAP
jgi:hypothetical protein